MDVVSKTRPWQVLLVLLFALAAAELGWLYVHLPPSPDQSVYDYVGWRLTEGDTLYADVTDQNWPGAMLLHALATALFGNHLWTFRLFDLLALLPLALAVLFLFLHRYHGRLGALLVLPVYLAMYVSADRWFSGQRDVIAAPLLIAAGMALLRRQEGGSRGWCAAAGACLAGAVLIRPTFLLLGPLLALWDLAVRRRPRLWLADQAVVAGTLAGLLAAVALAAVPSGALAAFWDSAILFNLQAYGPDARTWGQIGATLWHMASRAWPWYLALAAAGFVVLWRRGRRAPVAMLATVLLATLGSVLAQKKGWSYHMGPALPILALGIAALVAAAFETAGRSRRRYRLAVALLLALALIAGLAKKVTGTLGPQIAVQAGRLAPRDMLALYPAGFEERGFTMADAVELADYLETTVPPGGTALTWGRPMVMSYLARRPLPVRFASFALADLARPPFEKTDEWTREVERAFAQRPPRVVVLYRNPAGGHLYLGGARGVSPLSELVARQVASSYRRDASFGPAECFVREPGVVRLP